MAGIPDFTEAELAIINGLLERRYKEAIETLLADAELRLDPASNKLTEYPAVFWHARDCNFVIFKTGISEFRCQFFYDPNDQFVTNRPSFEDLATCVATLLQVQSDHERERQGVSSGATGSEIQ